VAEELGVRYILEGSVQRAGDQVRINAQLIDALNGGHVWAERFDGSLSDIFALQDKVARKSADALAVQLSASQEAPIAQKQTDNPLAYDAFLRGWEHYRRTTPEDYAKAIPYFEAAVRLDPNYSRASAALAMVHIRIFDRLWGNSLGIPNIEALAKAKRYLVEAQKRPNALSHQAAGYYLIYQGNFREALREFKDAMALDPGDSWSYAFAALALAHSRRPAEALPYIEVAMRLDPHPPPLFLNYLGLIQLGLSQFEKAATSLESAARLNPDDQIVFSALGAAYAHLGRKQDAATAIARYNEIVVAHGGAPLTLNYCNCGIEITQLMAGLRIAGVPVDLLHSDFAKQNRMSADEIRLLTTGHRLRGRSLHNGSEHAASLSKDGTATMSGDWVTGIYPLVGGAARFNGDELCLVFAARSYCGPVLRNPGGTRLYENEYIWHLNEPFLFSISDEA
jgi:tetratricopeptide (TPR) repeat protein